MTEARPIKTCVRCGGDLVAYPVLRGRAGRCLECSGIEADGEALSSIAGSELVSLMVDRAATKESSDLACPDCGEPMRSIGARRVEIDVCPDDEMFWMDGGEMAPFRPGLNDQNLADPPLTVPGRMNMRAFLLAIMLDWD